MFIYFYQNLFLHLKKKILKKKEKGRKKEKPEEQEKRKENSRLFFRKKKIFANFLNMFRCFWFSSVLLTPIIDGGNEKNHEKQKKESQKKTMKIDSIFSLYFNYRSLCMQNKSFNFE